MNTPSWIVIGFFGVWAYFTIGYLFAKWNFSILKILVTTGVPPFQSYILFPASSYNKLVPVWTWYPLWCPAGFGSFLQMACDGGGILRLFLDMCYETDNEDDIKNLYLALLTIFWPIKIITNLIIGSVFAIRFLFHFFILLFSYPARKLTNRNAKFWL